MGTVQKQRRLWAEITGRAPLRKLFLGAAKITIQEIESHVKPPLSAKEVLDSWARHGVTFWFDAVDGCIKARAFPVEGHE